MNIIHSGSGLYAIYPNLTSIPLSFKKRRMEVLLLNTTQVGAVFVRVYIELN